MPLQLRGGTTLKNRVLLAPMTTYSSHEDGRIADDELTYLHRRAASGLAGVITAACYVHKSGHAFRGQWSCSRDEDLPSLRAACEAIHSGGSTAFLQIHHGGRMAPSSLCGQSVSASAVPAERPNAETPKELTKPEIREIIDAYAKAAWRAREAGYDGVEIHGANTYLIQQFVSPHSNRRSDEYGEDRLLFVRELVESVLAAVGPNFDVGYRFSPEEMETPGIRWEHTHDLVETLLHYPLSFLHVSLRDFRQEWQEGPQGKKILNTLAEWVDKRVPLMAVGSIRTLKDIEVALSAGADLVSVGRAAVVDPDWFQNISSEIEPMTLIKPRAEAAVHVVPAGLEERIYTVPGWFPMEEPKQTAL